MAPNAARVYHLSILWALEDGHFPEEEESDEEALLYSSDDSSSEEEESSDGEGGEAASSPPEGEEEGGGPLFYDMPIVDMDPDLIVDDGNSIDGLEVGGGGVDVGPAEAGPTPHSDAPAPPFCSDLALFLAGVDLTPTSAFLYALSAPLISVEFDAELGAGDVSEIEE